MTTYTLPTIYSRNGFRDIRDWYIHVDTVTDYVKSDIIRHCGVNVSVTAYGYHRWTISSTDAAAANVAANWLMMTGAAHLISAVDDTRPNVDDTYTGRMYFYFLAQ